MTKGNRSRKSKKHRQFNDQGKQKPWIEEAQAIQWPRETEAVNLRRTGNTMIKGNRTKGQTMIYRTLHRKLKIKYQEPRGWTHMLMGVSSSCSICELVVLLLLQTRDMSWIKKGSDCDYDKRNISVVVICSIRYSKFNVICSILYSKFNVICSILYSKFNVICSILYSKFNVICSILYSKFNVICSTLWLPLWYLNYTLWLPLCILIIPSDCPFGILIIPSDCPFGILIIPSDCPFGILIIPSDCPFVS